MKVFFKILMGKKEKADLGKIDSKISPETARKIVEIMVREAGVNPNRCPKCGCNLTEEFAKLVMEEWKK